MIDPKEVLVGRCDGGNQHFTILADVTRRDTQNVVKIVEDHLDEHALQIIIELNKNSDLVGNDFRALIIDHQINVIIKTLSE